ncbi:Transcription repressor OFP8 [Carex littledalei]|uniref:Transcription repressor n=1 Tax=Carex littledalei TaxID=544730 RepID=A0A833QS66_9POAL|nr:Transcription repressor OFP8 [Carex littledalei]
MDRNKNSHGGGIKHRLTQILLRSACTASTSNTITTTTSFITISKNGTNQQKEGEPPGTPSLSMLLQEHRREKQTNSLTPKAKLERSSLLRTTPVIQVSIDCGGRRALHVAKQNHVPVPVKEEEENKKKKKSSPVSPSSPATRYYYSNQETRRKKIVRKPRKKEIKKLQSNPYGFSTSSSAHSDMEPGLFSSEGEEETQTVFSSKSFSSDSSELYHCTNKPKTLHVQPRKAIESPKRNAKRNIEVNKHPVSVSSKDRKVPDSGISISTACTGTGSGRAVVKRSSNPYMDFRSSMVEMIIEQKVISAKEMERLLQSYLALNATSHHPVIVRAFEDICEAIFSDE